MTLNDTETDLVSSLVAEASAARAAGRFPAAVAAYMRAIDRAPGNAETYVALAETYEAMGEFARAIPVYERVIALQPDRLPIYRSAVRCALKLAESVASSSKQARDLRKLAGMYLLALGRRQLAQCDDEAEASLREASTLDPKSADIFFGLAEFLAAKNRASEAEKPLRRAIALAPRTAEPHVLLGNILKTLRRYDEAEAAYRTAIALKPSLQWLRENLASVRLMNLLYDEKATAAEIFERHRAWGEEVAAACAGTAAASFPNSRDPNRRLRVAFLSGDFRYHAISFFFQPLLAHHDPAQIEMFCYAQTESPDAVTQYLQEIGGVWRNTCPLDDEALRRQMRADAIDVVIDLAGHTGRNRLRALAVKPAPVTATWLGYPATTGLPTIDWRITDARADPPGQECFHTEKLMRLPDVFLCYCLFAAETPEVEPVPALTTNRITFGSFNGPQKISTSAASAWSEILSAVPGSRLILKSIGYVEPTTRQRFGDLFAANGIGADRVEMRGPIGDPTAHLRTYGEIDIALDPFPYNGTTNTCEALWMGVPMVSLIGDRHAGRVGFDLLSQVGLDELAAPDIPSYVATAVALARDLPRLQALRQDLRERMRASPLCDAPRFARAFETALREMWRQWCDAAA